jgi:rubrerythrin
MISFAGKEVLELAIKIEQNGVTFYKSLADRATNSQISEVFSQLAQEEQDHISTLKEWLDKLAERETTESYPEEYGAYMKNLADESAYQCDTACQSLVSKAATELETIQVGLFFEKDFLLFLYEMRDFVTQADMSIIDSLIKEEKQHLIQLLRLKKNMETPSQ